ncbi:MAG: AmpG family muropeptide MFS transporter [Methylomonas sp.]|nr:MAG: AmpG family muropeptide MFS transporter [Methylomonas sp.]PPD24602.1 MAG: AmpG family muropeptide MFS transporter [Methylomonas sp.]PPD33217.1 MAG: AmpG family muropeptide MFS transporter [Methylomonas sp.]PPD37781.1 MAG: AmpG family muropeptide MFS transporter [Methylomonas sp.]PPD54255.1 MAG: AmpG family muropeptide MFS transporter [Methylomonas sp.]
MFFLGFSAGLPFILVSSTLSAWLADEGVSLSVIGYFSLVGVAYSVKVLWAPVVDRLPLPVLTRFLGKRRSWMLASQAGIVAGLWLMSRAATAMPLETLALCAVVVALCSATQDIVIDAYRIESGVLRIQGAMAAMYVFGYRVALLVAGAGALYLAEYVDWATAYQVMACLMLVGISATLLLNEAKLAPPTHAQAIENRLAHVLGLARPSVWWRAITKNFVDAVVAPFVEFFQRSGRHGLLILALIGLYKMSDIAMGVMANPFYLHLGFSKTQIADVTKVFGFFMTVIGTSLGGVLVVRYGVMRPLLMGAILLALTNLLFAVLAWVEPDVYLLAGVVSADNLCGGVAAAVFIAYLSGLTNTAYTATQYALFSSLMTLPAKLIGGLSGDIVARVGYDGFFIYAAATGLPAIVLVMIVMRQRRMFAQQSVMLDTESRQD